MQDVVEVDMAGLLRALGQELASLGAISEQLETILVTRYAAAANGPTAHGDIQSCDLLTQALYAMAGFLTRVAEDVPEAWRVDTTEATRKLPLAALASALSLRSMLGETNMAGELDMFT